MKTAGLLLACVVLTSCRFLPPSPQMNEAPENAPRARLRVVAEPKFAVVDGTPGGSCANAKMQGEERIIGFLQYQRREKAFDGRSIGMPDPERLDLSANMSRRARNNYSGELYIEADKPFLLTYYYNEYVFGYYRGCGFSLSFTPQEGKDYEARFWM
ncbi:MAG: hypothetical protein LBJ59_00780, partial [Zoogloeaceae bacterium]|nr:hypothetical protein [Zoogloeaceae bacterium]